MVLAEKTAPHLSSMGFAVAIDKTSVSWLRRNPVILFTGGNVDARENRVCNFN